MPHGVGPSGELPESLAPEAAEVFLARLAGEDSACLDSGGARLEQCEPASVVAAADPTPGPDTAWSRRPLAVRLRKTARIGLASALAGLGIAIGLAWAFAPPRADSGDLKQVAPEPSLARCCAMMEERAARARDSARLLWDSGVEMCRQGVVPPMVRRLPACKNVRSRWPVKRRK